MMKEKMNRHLKNLEGGLFLEVTKADVGEGAGNFMKQGGDIMAWADMYFPDPSLPESVAKAMHDIVDEGIPGHYVMPIGQYELREVLAEYISETIGRPIDPSRNIIITPGSDSGLLYAMMTFINEDDEILIPQPCYPSNLVNAGILGGVSVPVPLYEEDNYQIRIEELEKRRTPKTKMVVLTHPNNPTTTVFRKENIEELCKFIVKNDLILVSDQAFQELVYDDIEFVHPCMFPGMWERTLTVCSVSKGYGLSGLRIGYIFGDDHIMDVLYGGAVNVLGAASTASSAGAIAAIKDKGILEDNFERNNRRRKIAYDIFSQIPGVTMKISESGILSWLNISKLGSDEEISTRLMEDAHVMINQGTPYGTEGAGHIRIVTSCFYNDGDAILRFEKIRDVLTTIAKEKGIQ